MSVTGRIITSVFVVVGREEGPFSAPKALEAPMGELGPEPGALFVGVESRKHRQYMHGHTISRQHTLNDKTLRSANY